jgi:hypothetical protein
VIGGGGGGGGEGNIGIGTVADDNVHNNSN